MQNLTKNEHCIIIIIIIISSSSSSSSKLLLLLSWFLISCWHKYATEKAWNPHEIVMFA